MGSAASFPSLEDLWASCSDGTAAADAVYATLRRAIIDGRLRPGDRLSEQQLGRQFNVSRTPVREALHRLEMEQLAMRIPRGGLVVRTISEKELLEIYTVRIALDSLAARLAAEHALPADLAELRWINQRLAEAGERRDITSMARLNVGFHESLCRAAHNSMLLQFVRQVHDSVSRFGDTTFSYPGRAPDAVAEHERVLQAIEARDPDAAERFAREHMANARQVRIVMLQRAAAEAS